MTARVCCATTWQCKTGLGHSGQQAQASDLQGQDAHANCQAFGQGAQVPGGKGAVRARGKSGCGADFLLQILAISPQWATLLYCFRGLSKARHDKVPAPQCRHAAGMVNSFQVHVLHDLG